jgi:predicted exporter
MLGRTDISRGPTRSSNLKQEAVMTTIVHALSRTFQSAREIDALKQIAIFCAAGLLTSLLLLTYGVDLSPGFF